MAYVDFYFVFQVCSILKRSPLHILRTQLIQSYDETQLEGKGNGRMRVKETKTGRQATAISELHMVEIAQTICILEEDFARTTSLFHNTFPFGRQIYLTASILCTDFSSL